MIKYNREELIDRLSKNLRTLESKPEKNMHDRYLCNHLSDFLDIASGHRDPASLLLSAKKFSLFCTDSMNWGSEEYKNMISLGEYGRRLAKKEMSAQK